MRTRTECGKGTESSCALLSIAAIGPRCVHSAPNRSHMEVTCTLVPTGRRRFPSFSGLPDGDRARLASWLEDEEHYWEVACAGGDRSCACALHQLGRKLHVGAQ